MTPKDDKNIPVPAPEDDYSLEEILAEYGGSLEHQLLREAEAPRAPAPKPPPSRRSPALWKNRKHSPPQGLRRKPRPQSPPRPRTPSRRRNRRQRRTWPG